MVRFLREAFGVVCGALGFAFGVVLSIPGMALVGPHGPLGMFVGACTVLIASVCGWLAWAAATGRMDD